MGVYGAVGVGDVDAVVLGVYETCAKSIISASTKGGFGGLTIQSFVDMAESVREVYPRIHDGQSDKILEKRFANEDCEIGQRKLETREACILRFTFTKKVITSQQLR